MDLDESKARLAVDAAKKVAQSAIEDLTLSPEEKQKKDEQSSADRKKLLIKVVLGATVVAVVGITLMNLFARLWIYGVGLVVLAGVGGAGYLYAKPKLAAWNDRRLAGARAEAAEAEREAGLARAEQQKQLAAKKLEDDLARLKKQV